MKNYNIIAYLDGSLSPIDMEAESLPDALNLLIDESGDRLGEIVQVRQVGFFMDGNGRMSGVPEEM